MKDKVSLANTANTENLLQLLMHNGLSAKSTIVELIVEVNSTGKTELDFVSMVLGSNVSESRGSNEHCGYDVCTLIDQTRLFGTSLI